MIPCRIGLVLLALSAVGLIQANDARADASNAATSVRLTQAGPNADLRIEMTGMETCTRFNIAVLDITDGKRRITWSKKMSNRELAPTIRYTFRKIAPIVPGRGTQRSNPGTIYAQVQCFNAVDRPFKSQSNVGTFKVCGKGIVTTLLTRVETALLNLGKPRGASVKFIK